MMTMEKLNIRAIWRGITAYVLFYVFSMVAVTMLGNIATLSSSSQLAQSVVFAIIGSFAAGFIAGRNTRLHGAINGVTVGGAGAVLVMAVLMMLARTIGADGPVSVTAPFVLLLVIQSCVVCGVGGMYGQVRSGQAGRRDVR